MKKSPTKRIVAIVIAVAIVGVGGYFLFVRGGGESSAAAAQYTSYDVSTGGFEVTVHGSGTVTSASADDYDSLSNATEAFSNASAGDAVTKGDLLSVLKVGESDLSNAKETAEDSNYLSYNKLTTNSSEVTSVASPQSARVKEIYVEEGDDVKEKQQEGKPLMLLSGDGKMKLTFTPKEGSELSIGQRVNVKIGDSTKTGEIVKKGSTAEVVIEDDTSDIGAEATVEDKDGNELGTGTLELSDPIYITAGSGYVESINYEAGDKVGSGSTLMKLEKTGLESGVTGSVAVTAPEDGTLSAANFSGETSEESDSSALFTLQSKEDYELTLSVDELDISSVKAGQKVNVSLDALPDKQFTGTVKRVSSVGSAEGGVTTYEVVVTLDSAEGVLAGMTASADIVTDSVENALLVPVEALQNGRFVLSSDIIDASSESSEPADMANYMKQVEVGLVNDTFAEIKSGLSEGDSIAVPMQGDGENGMRMMMGGGMMDMGAGEAVYTETNVSGPGGGGRQRPDGDGGAPPMGGN